MVWFKVDDQFAIHEKVAEAGNQAIGLWVRAGAWSCMRLTDGLIPAHVLPMLGATATDADALVGAGLWDAVDGGYEFHDWAEYQPTAESVREQREREREKKRRQRRDSRGQYSKDDSVRPEGVPRGHARDSRGSPTVPEPEPEPLVSTDVETIPHRSAVVREFDRAWEHWPKKVEKKAALAKFERASKQHPPEWLADRVIEFGTAYAATTERRFTPGLAVWLNGERWTDELPQPSSRESSTGANLALIQQWEEQERGAFGGGEGDHLRELTGS